MLCDSAQPAEASVNKRDAPEHHRPAAEAVGQRAVKQVHEGKAEQVGRQRLLHLDRRGAQRLRDAGERRDVGVDGKRPQHAEHGQQGGKCPARGAPELVGVGVHAFFSLRAVS
jgi:hypothetical protein